MADLGSPAVDQAERSFGVCARFIVSMPIGQGQFEAIDAISDSVRDLDGVDEVFSAGTAVSNWMPEEQVDLDLDSETTYLVLVRFIEFTSSGDAAVDAVSARLVGAGLDTDEVFLAAEYEN